MNPTASAETNDIKSFNLRNEHTNPLFLFVFEITINFPRLKFHNFGVAFESSRQL